MKHYVEIEADGKKMGFVPKTHRAVIKALKNLKGIKMKTITEEEAQRPPRARTKKPKQEEMFGAECLIEKPKIQY